MSGATGNDIVVVRNAGLSDYRTLCDIFAKANDFHCELRHDYYRKVRPIISKKDFYLAAIAQWFKAGRKLVCAKIFELDGKDVGAIFALSSKGRLLEDGEYEKEVDLDNIFVDKDYRNIGVGTALLNSVQEWGRGTGHQRLHTKIVSNNHLSRKFFYSNGCKDTDVVLGMDLDKVSPVISEDIILQIDEREIDKFSAKVMGVKGCIIGEATASSVERRSLGWSKYEKEACIDNIFVKEEFRRQGIGTAILNAAKEWAKKTKHSYLYTKIVSNNDPSKSFFSANGCEETDVIVGKCLDIDG